MDERLNLLELVDLLSKKQGLTKKEAELFLRELFAIILENIKSLEPVKIKDFGTFKPTKVSARKSVNVNTGEEFEIPAHYKLNFIPDKALREAVNKPFSHFESVILEDGVTFENVEIGLSDNEDEDIEGGIDIEETTDKEKQTNNLQKQIGEIKAEIEQIEEPKKDENIDTSPATPIATEGTIKEEVEILTTSPIIEEKVESEVVDNITEEIIETPSTPADKDDSEIEYEQIVEEEIIAKEEEIAEKESEKDIDIIEQYEEEEVAYYDNRRKNRVVVLCCILAILAIALGITLYTGHAQQFLADRGYWNGEQEKKNIVTDTLAIGNIQSNIDSIQTSTDSVKANQPIDSIATQKEKVIEQAKYKSITETIEYGVTLRNLGLKHYGAKSFWVYIFLDNKDKIKNPNNVPIGTKLAIPQASKYGIDKNDKEALAKARKMEEEIYKEFGIK